MRKALYVFSVLRSLFYNLPLLSVSVSVCGCVIMQESWQFYFVLFLFIYDSIWTFYLNMNICSLQRVSHKVWSLLIVLVPDGRFMWDERRLIKFPVLFGSKVSPFFNTFPATQSITLNRTPNRKLQKRLAFCVHVCVYVCVSVVLSVTFPLCVHVPTYPCISFLMWLHSICVKYVCVHVSVCPCVHVCVGGWVWVWVWVFAECCNERHARRPQMFNDAKQ